MTTIDQLDRELARLEEQKGLIRFQKLNLLRRRVIKCNKCNQGSQALNWIFIQSHYYIKPYSCTGGDTWVASETDVCYLECPKCKSEIYICTHPEKDKIVALVNACGFSKDKLFKKVIERNED